MEEWVKMSPSKTFYHSAAPCSIEPQLTWLCIYPCKELICLRDGLYEFCLPAFCCQAQAWHPTSAILLSCLLPAAGRCWWSPWSPCCLLFLPHTDQPSSSSQRGFSFSVGILKTAQILLQPMWWSTRKPSHATHVLHQSHERPHGLGWTSFAVQKNPALKMQSGLGKTFEGDPWD